MTAKKTPKPAGKRRSALGSDPLDAVFGGPVVAASKASRRRLAPYGTTPRPPEPEKPYKVQKIRATFHLPAELLDECRDAVVALSGPPVRLTLAGLAEDGIRRELGRLRKLHRHGKPWPRRQGELKGGRPISK